MLRGVLRGGLGGKQVLKCNKQMLVWRENKPMISKEDLVMEATKC